MNRESRIGRQFAKRLGVRQSFAAFYWEISPLVQRLTNDIILARTDPFSWIERKNGRRWLITPEEREAFVRAVSG